MDFVDYSIEITGTPGDYSVRAESPFMNPAHGEFELPYTEAELEGMLDRVELAVLKGTGRRRSLQPTHLSVVQEFGSSLFSALVHDEIEESYYDAFRRTSEQGKGLRIRLTPDPPELAGLPWELLFDPRQRDFVSLAAATPLVRHLRTPNPAPALSVDPPLRVLVMVATPDGLYQLDVDAEKARLEEALSPLVGSGLVEIGWVEGGTWRDLQDALFHGPWHVFHFIGHGAFDEQRSEGVLAFERESDHRLRTVTPAELGRLIDRDHSLRLVVLNACEGARGDEHDALSSLAARLVYRSVPAALAMQWEISDEAAIEFSRTFYRSLSVGSPVDAGVADARISVSLAVEGSLEWATPVLFMRAPDGRIFDIDPSAAMPPVSPVPGGEVLAAVAEAVVESQTAPEQMQAEPGASSLSTPPELAAVESEPVRTPEPAREVPQEPAHIADASPPAAEVLPPSEAELPSLDPVPVAPAPAQTDATEEGIGKALLRVLFLTFFWQTIASMLLMVASTDFLTFGPAWGGILTAVWGTIYFVASRRLVKHTDWTSSHALRSAPYVPFRLGGLWNVAGLPANAFFAHALTYLDAITDLSVDDWSAYPFFILSLALPVLYWVAVGRFIKRETAGS